MIRYFRYFKLRYTNVTNISWNLSGLVQQRFIFFSCKFQHGWGCFFPCSDSGIKATLILQLCYFILGFLCLLMKGKKAGILSRPQTYNMLPTSFWQELSHKYQTVYKWCWEMSSYVPTCRGRLNDGKITLQYSCLTWPSPHGSFVGLQRGLVLFYQNPCSTPH